MINKLHIVLSIVLAFVPASAFADFAKVDQKDEFMRLVAGKTLTRPWIKLRVTNDGRIQGTGLRWDVRGEWSWQNGYFCRSLFWDGDDLGYNCQEVKADGSRIRFTSDKGSGMTAVFSLN